MKEALVLLICLVIAGGVTGALLRAWNLLMRVRSLEISVDKLHTQLRTEITARAGKARWSNKDIQEALPLMPSKPKEEEWWATYR